MDIVGSRTLRDLWEELARTSADRTFLVFEDRDGVVTEWTYGQFAVRIVRTANLFRSWGVAPGDHVGVHLGNCPEMLECLFGLALVGAVSVPFHPRSTATECNDIQRRVGARVVVAEPDVLPEDGYAGDPRILLARSQHDVPGTTPYGPARDAQPDVLADRVSLASEDPVGIVFTSGSTACPKGVVLTHANLLFSGLFVDWQATMTAQDRLLTTMPACHVNFQLNALMPVLTAGATLVAVERFSARRFWAQVREHRATVVQSIAMMLRTTMLQPVAPDERDHQVREVLYYLPVTDEEKVAYEQRFGVRLLNSYGTSETLVGVLTDPPVGERRWPSVGRVGLGYEVRIADGDGHEVPVGTVGEIQVRGVPGRTLMKEYFRDPEATAAAITPEGWFRTGDLGRADADGWHWFVDRRTHFVKRSGENVSPTEVEEVLTRHPAVAEAAVIGVPDPVHDEAVKAFVVLVPGQVVTVAQVRAHCAAHLADFKVPTIVEVVDDLPRTTTFKVAKAALV
jgi:crotonobetaine/carnitine-CoA ligase